MSKEYDIYLYNNNTCKFENKTNEIKEYFVEDNFLKVIFHNNIDGKIYPYSQNKYFIKKPTNSYSLINYLYNISNIQNQIKDENKLLYITYSYFINQSISIDSALYKFFNPNELKTDNIKNTLIFPFSTNKSQCEAVEKAFTSQISVIEGPPGTGKTQTILNIIANIIYNGKTVAVVSNNNDATDNIYEKLEKDKLNFICAKLGNKSNKEEFIKNQTLFFPEFIINKNNLKIDKHGINQDLPEIYKKVLEIFESEITIAKCREELDAVRLEYSHYLKENKHEKVIDYSLDKLIEKISYKTILKEKLLIKYYNKIPFFLKLKLIYKYKLGKIHNYFGKNKLSLNTILNILDNLYYQLKELQLKKQITDIEIRLKNLDKDVLTKELKTKSMELFLNTLSARYINKGCTQYREDLFNNSDILLDFLNDYPVVLSSTHSIKNTLKMDHYLFDYIIIDESSQVDLLTGILALSVARNAIIVGDSKQLPPIINDDNNNTLRKQVQELNSLYEIPDEFDYLKNSLLDSVCKIIDGKYRTLLKEHYRCHPHIIGFCNKMFYNNELIICSDYGLNNQYDVLKAIVTVPGNHANKDHVNKKEIASAIDELFIPIRSFVENSDIGVVVPYKNQAAQFKKDIEELEDEIGKENKVKIETVHKFQGQEKDVVIMTTVSNDINDFIENKNLINVAISRAKKAFYIVTSHKVRNSNSIISSLIDYIEYNNYTVDTSKIKSIFDILYQDVDDILQNYLNTQERKYKKLCEEYYKSSSAEKIAYFHIQELIKEQYPILKIRQHIPLRDIINLDAKLENPLNDDEILFMQYDSHIDILLINTMNKQAVLAIEIDGATFHNQEEQKHRDNKKNSIFAKYNLPLLRLNTRDSNEIDKIRSILYNILGY